MEATDRSATAVAPEPTRWGVGRRLPPGPDVTELIAEQAAAHPGAVALVCGDEEVTYGELATRTGRLARLLRSRGVGPEVPVGVCLQRSTDHVVALVAILRAGGAYVPLDPEAPAERTAYVLEDSGAALVVAHAALADRVAGPGVPVLCLDRGDTASGDGDGDGSAGPPEECPHPDQLAYLIYTSGSTGRPKGVMIERGPLSGHCRAMVGIYGLDPHDRVLQFSQYSADASLEQILPTLAAGARLVLRGGEIWSPDELREELVRHQVTVMNFSPAYWAQVVRTWARTPEALAGLCLRLVILGGERLSAQSVRQWLDLGVGARVLNAYGPTEATITTTLSEAGEEGDLITIGRPLPGRTLYVLDPDGRPVPAGVRGELYIGGGLLARGYLHRESLTAERFVPDPFDPGGTGRLYRTGDHVHVLDDGRLVFHGRIDDQVKVRGYRIELGEIEAALAEHPAVQEAAVTVRGEGETAELVAYVVPAGPGAYVEADLRRHLEGKLPRSMQPAVFAPLEAMPRLATGKPDRGSLPEVERGRRDRSGYVAPRRLVEKQLVQLWEELLGTEPIGIGDNFFHLGGHSLLAAQLVHELDRHLARRVALSTLFANPTVEQLAAALDADQQRGARARVLPVQATGDRTPFFFLHGDWTGGAFFCFALARACGAEQPFFAVEPLRFDAGGRPPTVEAVARAHLEAVWAVQPKGPYRLGGFCNGGLLAYEMARQLEAKGEEVEFLGLVNPSEPVQPGHLPSVCDAVGRFRRPGEGPRPDLYLRVRHGVRHLVRRARPGAPRVADFDKLVEIEPRLAGPFPPADALYHDYAGVLSWARGSYRPDGYGGRITFFWAAEEPGIAATWLPVTRALPPASVEEHLVPGDHLTSVTDGIDELAPALAGCLDRLAGEPGGAAPAREGARGPVAIRPLRARDVPTVVGMERRVFPKDHWTSATAGGWLARSRLGVSARWSWWLERAIRASWALDLLNGARFVELAALGRPAGSTCVVAQAPAGIVGYACLGPRAGADGTGAAGVAELETIAVHPDQQGRGIGAVLLDAVVERAVAQGYRTVSLHVRVDNDPARRLYGRRGFEETGVVPGFYQPSGTGALIMVLDLAPGPGGPGSDGAGGDPTGPR